MFYYYHWVYTSAGISPEGIIRTDMLFYLFVLSKFTIPNYVIIIKTKILLPKAYLPFVDFGYPV